MRGGAEADGKLRPRFTPSVLLQMAVCAYAWNGGWVLLRLLLLLGWLALGATACAPVGAAAGGRSGDGGGGGGG